MRDFMSAEVIVKSNWNIHTGYYSRVLLAISFYIQSFRYNSVLTAYTTEYCLGDSSPTRYFSLIPD